MSEIHQAKKEMSGRACAAFMGAVVLGMAGSAIVLDKVLMPGLGKIGDAAVRAYVDLNHRLAGRAPGY